MGAMTRSLSAAKKGRITVFVFIFIVAVVMIWALYLPSVWVRIVTFIVARDELGCWSTTEAAALWRGLGSTMWIFSFWINNTGRGTWNM